MLKTTLALISFVILSSALGIERRADRPVFLRELVPSTDPLSRQDLCFDARFANTALEYVRSGVPELMEALAGMPASRHLLNHARQFDYDVPKTSALALVRSLLSPSGNLDAKSKEVETNISYFTGPLIEDPSWVRDVLDYLPEKFRFHGSLFLTFGYDIGVALAPNASLNAANSHFKEKPRELLYYAIHELHHVGVMTYKKPPRISDLRTCADILRLVDYSTELEGLGVLAARPRRTIEHALQDDPDYVALGNPEQMRELEKRYSEQYRYLQSRGAALADKAAFDVVNRMSSGDRLWYRVGAMMSARIENKLGRKALLQIIADDQPALVSTYRRLFPDEP